MVSKVRLYLLTIGFVLFGTNTINAAQLLFTPTLTLSEEYTDNLFLTKDNTTDDFVTTASLGLSGQVLWRTAGLKLNYTPTYNKYADNSKLDHWRHAADLYTWKEIAKHTKLEFRETYLRTNNPTDKSDAIDPEDPLLGSAIESDPNRRGRNEYYTNNAYLSLTHNFGANDSFYFAYRYRVLRDVDVVPGRQVDDNDIKTLSGGVAYDFTNRWTARLSGNYQDEDYKERNDRVKYDGQAQVLYNFDRTLSAFVGYRHTILNYDLDTDEDYQIYQPTIGFEKKFKDNARISVGVGYYIQDFETSDDDSSAIADAEIYKRWESQTTFIDVLGTSGYTIDDAGVQDNGLRIHYAGKITFGYRLTQWLTSNIYGAYRYDDYPNASESRTDNTIEAGAGIDWQVLQWMIAGLSYRFRNVNSDVATNEYTENSVVLSISMAPPLPYRLN